MKKSSLNWLIRETYEQWADRWIGEMFIEHVLIYRETKEKLK